MHPQDCGSNMGPRVLAIVWTLAALTTLIVSLRLYTQQRVVHKLGWPDTFIILAWMTALTCTACNTAAIAHGLGARMDCLQRDDQLSAMQWKFVALLPGQISAPLARISFCLYLLRFVGLCKHRKYALWGVVVSQAVVNLACMIGSVVMCMRESPHWNLRHKKICWASKTMVKVAFAQGAFNAATDLVLTTMPFSIVRKLKMARSTKIALSILIGMSILTMIACILVAVEIDRLSKSKDLTYDTARFTIWLALERYAAIIAVSVPHIRALAISIPRSRLRWFRTPETNTPTLGDRRWITRNPTQFTFGSVRCSTSISRHPLSLPIDEIGAIELSVLNNPPPRAKSIKRTRDFMVDFQERKEGDGFDETFMSARGLNRSVVGGPLASHDGIWDD